MASIDRIIARESDNTTYIHLYRVGLFYRAFQRSAYLFQTQVRNFKAVKKFYKTTGSDAVIIGFPSVMLDELFPKGGVETVAEGYLRIPCDPVDTAAYQVWFATVRHAPEKVKKFERAAELQTRMLAEKPAPPPSETRKSLREAVLQEVETFAIENATPLDCMMFLNELKRKLKCAQSYGAV